MTSSRTNAVYFDRVYYRPPVTGLFSFMFVLRTFLASRACGQRVAVRWASCTASSLSFQSLVHYSLVVLIIHYSSMALQVWLFHAIAARFISLLPRSSSMELPCSPFVSSSFAHLGALCVCVLLSELTCTAQDIPCQRQPVVKWYAQTIFRRQQINRRSGQSPCGLTIVP